MNLSEGPAPHRLPLLDRARPESPWVHPPTGLCFLQESGRIRANACFRYDATGTNVSVRYAVRDALLVSVYVFPIPAGPEVVVLRANFHNAVLDVISQLGAPHEIDDREVAWARPGGIVVRGRSARVVGTAPRGSPASIGLLELFGLGRWAIKFRATCTPRSADAAKWFIDEWLLASRIAEDSPDARPAGD